MTTKTTKAKPTGPAPEPVEPAADPTACMTPDYALALNIHQRMMGAVNTISTLVKGDMNSFHQYKYVSHDDVVRKVREAFKRWGILAVMDIPAVEIEEGTDDKGKGVIRAFVHASMAFINPDRPEDRYSVSGATYSIDSSDKAVGKAISYLKKYFLIAQSGLMLATGEDQDQDAIEWNRLTRKVKSAGAAHAAAPEPCQELDPETGEVMPTERDLLMDEWAMLRDQNNLHQDRLKAELAVLGCHNASVAPPAAIQRAISAIRKQLAAPPQAPPKVAPQGNAADAKQAARDRWAAMKSDYRLTNKHLSEILAEMDPPYGLADAPTESLIAAMDELEEKLEGEFPV